MLYHRYLLLIFSLILVAGLEVLAAPVKNLTTVDGISLGMSASEAESILGKPPTKSPSKDGLYESWEYGGPSGISFRTIGSKRIVSGVSGRTLRKGSNFLAREGDSKKDILEHCKVLGKIQPEIIGGDPTGRESYLKVDPAPKVKFFFVFRDDKLVAISMQE